MKVLPRYNPNLGNLHPTARQRKQRTIKLVNDTFSALEKQYKPEKLTSPEFVRLLEAYRLHRGEDFFLVNKLRHELFENYDDLVDRGTALQGNNVAYNIVRERVTLHVMRLIQKHCEEYNERDRQQAAQLRLLQSTSGMSIEELLELLS